MSHDHKHKYFIKKRNVIWTQDEAIWGGKWWWWRWRWQWRWRWRWWVLVQYAVVVGSDISLSQEMDTILLTMVKIAVMVFCDATPSPPPHSIHQQGIVFVGLEWYKLCCVYYWWSKHQNATSRCCPKCVGRSKIPRHGLLISVYAYDSIATISLSYTHHILYCLHRPCCICIVVISGSV